jgi:Tol biopolymer transport system component
VPPAVVAISVLMCTGFVSIGAAGARVGAGALIAFNESCSVFVIRSDGGARTRLTRPPNHRCDRSAGWSPDGTRVAFVRSFTNVSSSSREPVPSEVYLVNADGSGMRRLSKRILDAGSPRWSPDGKTIAIAANGGAGIRVVGSDGRHDRALTPKVTGWTDPSWSPDGRSVVFTRNRIAKHGIRGAVYAVPVGRGTIRRITVERNGEHSSALWSPDGRRIVFQRAPCALDGFCGTEVRVLDIVSGQERALVRLSGGGALQGGGSWSPDGAQILFGPSNAGGIWSLRSDRHARRVLTRGSSDVEAAWSRDGRRIAFTRLDYVNGGRNWIHLMNADGSGQRKLTRGNSPSWRS